MSICGYHLRCLNYGYSCMECRHQYCEKNKDYLYDILNVWGKGKDVDSVIEADYSRDVNGTPIRIAV